MPAAEVLQSSAATYLRCCGKHNTDLATNLFQNPTVNELLLNSCQCYTYEKSVIF